MDATARIGIGTETAKRIGRRATVAAVAFGLALGVAAVGQPASALPINRGIGVAADCYFEGVRYSDGSIITMNGAKYKCQNGSWVFFSSGVYAQ